jgi:hypothetical protein
LGEKSEGEKSFGKIGVGGILIFISLLSGFLLKKYLNINIFE